MKKRIKKKKKEKSKLCCYSLSIHNSSKDLNTHGCVVIHEVFQRFKSQTPMCCYP